MLIIMKFGGTSVGNGSTIKNVAKIISDFKKENDVVVVVSAMEGVTDSIINFAEDIHKKDVDVFIEKLKIKHEMAAKISIDNLDVLDETLRIITNILDEFGNALKRVQKKVTKKEMDYLMSFGERLSAPIICGAIKNLGIDSVVLTGNKAGIITDSNYGSAKPIKITSKKILTPLLKRKIVPVITGFIAQDEKGTVTTFGRGGSDYTASLIGADLGADEIQIWTDVDGILTADPKIVDDANLIKRISYEEVMELAFFGAKVLHPKTIKPAMDKQIPVNVRNTFKPSCEGTLIIQDKQKSHRIVKAICNIEDVALINVSGTGMMGVPGVIARVFDVLAAKDVNILMVSQGSSETNISIVIHKEDLEKSINSLEEEFRDGELIQEITYRNDICVITVVGAGMRGTYGIAARIFGAVAAFRINILMIAQGSSEVSISFVINKEHLKEAVCALHKNLIQGELEEVK